MYNESNRSMSQCVKGFKAFYVSLRTRRNPKHPLIYDAWGGVLKFAPKRLRITETKRLASL